MEVLEVVVGTGAKANNAVGATAMVAARVAIGEIFMIRYYTMS